MLGVKLSHHRPRLPAIITAGSFLCLLLIVLLTSPVKDIAWAMAFFVSLLVFLLSVGYTVVYLQAGQMRRVYRYRIIIASLFIVIVLMFRSAQSLSWIDGLVLLIITTGLLFYSGRRA
jgi:FtsH-binding integral membrane protein